MQLCTQVIESCLTAYLTIQLSISTFRLEKSIQNDVMTIVYHDVMTTYIFDMPTPTLCYAISANQRPAFGGDILHTQSDNQQQ